MVFVFRAPKVGGAIQTLAHDQVELEGLSVDDDFVYWATRGSCEQATARAGAAWRVGKRGGDPERLGPIPCGTPTQVLVDTSHPYLTGNDGVRRLPKAGGDPVMFALAGTNPHASTPSTVLLRDDATHVYWGDSFGPLWAQAKDAPLGEKTKLLDASPWTAVVDDQFVHWVEDGSVRRIRKTGGPIETVGRAGTEHATAMTADQTDVYYTNIVSREVWRFAKDGTAPAARFVVGQQAFAIAIDAMNIFYPHYGTTLPAMAPVYIAKSGSIERRPK